MPPTLPSPHDAPLPQELREPSLRLLKRLDELAAALTARARAAVKEFAALAELPLENLCAMCTAHLSCFYRYLAGLAPLDLEAARADGRRRAEQGMPLPVVLHGYRIGALFIWESLRDEADLQEPGTASALLEHVTTIWLALDRYSEAVQDSYRETVAERVRIQGRERERLLAILFGENAQKPVLLLDSADALDLPRRGTFCVVASDGAKEAAGSDGTYDPPSVQLRLREQGVDSVWRRSAQECLGIISLGPDLPTPSSVTDCLQSALLGRIGISPVYGDIVHTGRAVLKARLARSCLPADETGPCHYGDRPVGLLIANAPETADEIAARTLAPVLAQPAEDCELLLATARAWYRARGSASGAAQTLYCHPNTVRYRLKRLESLTGLALDDPQATTDLFVALEALSLRPPRSGNA